jgi:hypothetical protein
MSIGELREQCPELVNIASLAFEIESTEEQELSLRVWISEGEGVKNLQDKKNKMFVSREFKVRVAEGSKLIIHLDHELDHKEQERAQPLFVQGNTVALIVFPRQKQKLFKVRAGKLGESSAIPQKAGR